MGPIHAFGVEGTGSYDAALSRFLCEHGHPVFEVNRPSRQLWHQKGKDGAMIQLPEQVELAGHGSRDGNFE